MLQGEGNNRAERRRRAAFTADLTAGLEHHRAGRLARAEALYRRFLQRAPGNPEALHLLGLIAVAKGDPQQAVELIGKALAASPNFAEAHSNLGNALRAAGRPAEACASYRHAIALRPDFAAAHSNLGLVLREQGQFAAALASCERAAQLDPRSVDLQINLGDLHLELRRFEAAAACYRSALALAPRHAGAHRGLATGLRALGDVEAAIAHYREALTISSGDASAWNDLGRCFLARGRFEDAVEAFHRALAIDPDLADAYRNLAACGRLVADDPRAAMVAGVMARTDLPAEERAAAGFSIGKALDDAGRHEEAFAAYDQANRLYREARAAAGDCFDPAALTRQIDGLIADFSPAFFAAVNGWGNPSQLPVFIVGMPRSGTSLIEQIVASHSRVFGAGELRDIGEAVAGLGPTPRAWTEPLVRRAADARLEKLRARAENAERISDKLPDNIFTLGAVAALYPGARIIFCRRDPRDIGVSCFFQKFSAGLLTFSYDLADCGRRIRETERLAAHWRRVLPLRTLDIRYEALVADLAGESRKLIEFLGLPWEAACLDFHRTARTVQTASAWQVRQPLYDRSVGRWRHYERHLGPLLDELAVGGA